MQSSTEHWCNDTDRDKPEAQGEQSVTVSLLKRFHVQTVCAACSRTGYRIVPLTNLNRYLHNDTSETGVNVRG
jgi:hypothetical protein